MSVGITPEEQSFIIKKLDEEHIPFKLHWPAGRGPGPAPMEVVFEQLAEDKSKGILMRVVDQLFPSSPNRHVRENMGAYIIS